MKLEARDRVVVVGKTGYGKSHWTKRFLSEARRHHRVVVFDPCDEYSQQGHRSPAITLGPLSQRCTVEQLENDPRRWLDRDDLALSVVPSGDPDEVAAEFESTSDLLKSTGNLCFVVEEVGYFAEHCQERVKAVATMYRHYEISAVFVAQRAIQIPKTARSQASQLVAFRQDEPDDLQALEQRCGHALPDIADRVARLRVGEHVHWRDNPSPKE